MKRSESDDDGFGLIEVVVSMFILAMLSLAFLPMLVTAMKASVTNASVATASQLTASQLELVRQTPPETRTCASLRAISTASVSNPLTATDARGKVLSVTGRLVSSSTTDSNGCPIGGAGLVTYVATVTSGVPALTIATATTLLYVAS